MLLAGPVVESSLFMASVSASLPSVVDSGDMPDSPLEVCVGVGLDKSEDRPNLTVALVGGGVAGVGLVVAKDGRAQSVLSFSLPTLGREKLL